MGFGLRPVARLGGSYHTGGVQRFPANNAAAIYTGDIALITNGVVSSIAATPTGATAALSADGVVVGAEYTDSSGARQWAQYMPAGATDAYIYVVTDPFVVFEVEADAALVSANVGKRAGLKTFGGSTATGLSTVQLDQGSIGTATTLAVRILEIPDKPDNLSANTTIAVVAFGPQVHSALNGNVA